MLRKQKSAALAEEEVSFVEQTAALVSFPPLQRYTSCGAFIVRYLLALASTITPAALIATLALVATAASPGITTRVSVDSAGNQGNGFSGFPSISADGRIVAFYSDASNLVTQDKN